MTQGHGPLGSSCHHNSASPCDTRDRDWHRRCKPRPCSNMQTRELKPLEPTRLDRVTGGIAPYDGLFAFGYSPAEVALLQVTERSFFVPWTVGVDYETSLEADQFRPATP